MANRKVLIIDDSFDITRVLKSAIFTLDPEIEVFVTPSAEEAMLEISKGKLDLIITDIRLPGISGLEMLRKIRDRHPQVKIVMMSGITDSDIEERARDAGANIFMHKPIEMPFFLNTISLMLNLKTAGNDKDAPMLPEFDLLNEDDYEKNLADSMASLRKEVAGSHVWLLSEAGRLVAQSGESLLPDFESKWAALIMPMMSSSDTFMQHIEGKRADRAVFCFGIKDYNLFMSPIGDYALVLRVPAGRGSQRIPLVVDVVLEFQGEIMQILNRMGVLPVEQSLEVPLEETFNSILEENIEDDEDDVFKALLDNKTKLSEIDKFWDEADIAKAYDLDNPDILTFDQAAKLGLAPDKEDD